ncbi:phasin family protein [Pseudomarimonas salicorniae]|uniref:Phasin family protein n=1 Tax=Pseudomarimonas salicorniae TaxID=2933270 RepID=A0ABT0GHT9_9GAMM|nr:phasin family protein [Lysobacter sp. CAU 1642]MCK7594108.1 phasin family protein [Lysobacter sp. CAU 1642]
MVKQVKTRKAAAKRNPDFNARQLWLASLGAASLTRKQGIKLYDAMVEEGTSLQGKVNKAVDDAKAQVGGAIENVRGRIDGVVAPVRERAEATFVVIKDEVETRLQPVLARFGKAKPTTKRAPAKRRAAPKARKAPAKRTRKAA